MDDELNVLPTSSHVKSIAPIRLREDGRRDVPENGAEAAAEVKHLRESLVDTQVTAVLAVSYQQGGVYSLMCEHQMTGGVRYQ